MITADLQAHKVSFVTRCDLVNVQFSLVYVPGKRLISLLCHCIKSLGTNALESSRQCLHNQNKIILRPITNSFSVESWMSFPAKRCLGVSVNSLSLHRLLKEENQGTSLFKIMTQISQKKPKDVQI